MYTCTVAPVSHIRHPVIILTHLIIHIGGLICIVTVPSMNEQKDTNNFQHIMILNGV